MSDAAANDWKPNEEYLQGLIQMGISKTAAEEALFCTSNSSLEAAINYVFDSNMGGIDDRENTGRVHSRSRKRNDVKLDAGHISPDGYKMVFVVNMALPMKTGKIAAQVAHACLGLYRELLETPYESKLDYWEEEGEKKIVLQGENHLHLLNLEEQAKREGLGTYLVRDAGRTQIPPDSITVLAVFGKELNVNNVTGDLNLL